MKIDQSMINNITSKDFIEVVGVLHSRFVELDKDQEYDRPVMIPISRYGWTGKYPNVALSSEKELWSKVVAEEERVREEVQQQVDALYADCDAAAERLGIPKDIFWEYVMCGVDA